jgi:hypothetical protein
MWQGGPGRHENPSPLNPHPIEELDARGEGVPAEANLKALASQLSSAAHDELAMFGLQVDDIVDQEIADPGIVSAKGRRLVVAQFVRRWRRLILGLDYVFLPSAA